MLVIDVFGDTAATIWEVLLLSRLLQAIVPLMVSPDKEIAELAISAVRMLLQEDIQVRSKYRITLAQSMLDDAVECSTTVLRIIVA